MKTLKSKIITLILLVGFSVTFQATSQEKKFQWQLLSQAKNLNENQKKDLIELLKKEFSYGACPDTIYNCLLEEKPDKTSIRLANFSAYLLSKNVPARGVSLALEKRGKIMNPVKTHNFRLDKSPTFGNKEAPITVVEFAEFKCPYCEILVPIMKKIVNDSDGKVRHVFKHFPLKSHEGTVLASQGAEAAHAQGKFWEMYELLYQDKSKQGLEDLIGYAQKLGLDVEKFKKDLKNEEFLEKIERDKIEGMKAGVSGTPTLYINGKLYDLRLDEDFLKDILNEEAEKLGISPPYKD